MANYEELNIGVRLVNHTPIDIINIFNNIVNGIPYPDDHQIINHTINLEQLNYILTCPGSYYFSGIESTQFELDQGSYYLSIRRNYSRFPPIAFVAWLDCYIDALHGQFLGYTLMEGSDCPYLLYHNRI